MEMAGMYIGFKFKKHKLDYGTSDRKLIFQNKIFVV